MNVGLSFYFGRLSEFGRLSLEMVAAQLDQVHLFTDTKLEKPLHSVKVHYISAREVERRISNVLGANLQIVHPYKLCDLRPFWYLLADLSLTANDMVYWVDSDCIWGKDLKRHLPPASTRTPVIIGNRGHFGGMSVLLAKEMPRVLDSVVSRKKWMAPVTIRSHTGFDEFRYWNKVASRLAVNGTVTLLTDVSRHAVDLSYWSCTPRCVNRSMNVRDAEFRSAEDGTHVFARFGDGSRQEVPYIHLQKRKVLVRGVSLSNDIYLRFNSEGDVELSLAETASAVSFSETRWKLKMLGSRVKAKLYVEALPWQHVSF